ncbi:hypothetical protein [Bradyrhizobium yuanmingense]|uniref:Transposase n=1 Tax=Bradyrhizobium yuanmingense TaxID=108015 RepID=A0ABV4GUY8_9BRAD|nr:hypothetical protein [Bradyrhizobium yuanmingense]
MNRTSKRIIYLSVQTLDQPSISPLAHKTAPTSRREFTGLRNHIEAGLKTLAEQVLADSGTLYRFL